MPENIGLPPSFPLNLGRGNRPMPPLIVFFTFKFAIAVLGARPENITTSVGDNILSRQINRSAPCANTQKKYLMFVTTTFT